MADNCNKEGLNFVWSLYPGYPASPYSDYEHYLQEITRLHRTIESINDDIQSSSHKVLFHLAIGAAMDEMLNMNPTDKHKYKHQYYQLEPKWIDKYFDSYPDGKGYIIIISPNQHFSSNHWEPPQFLKITSDIYDWEEIDIDNKHYRSKVFDIDVFVFCTPMPHDDSQNIKKMLRKMEHDGIYDPYGKVIEQTPSDIDFVLNFYEQLGKLFDTINDNGGIVTCLSSAVFKNKSIRNCHMFSEILKLFRTDKYNYKHRLLMEWVYNSNVYYGIPYFSFTHKINYGLLKEDGTFEIEFQETDDNKFLEISLKRITKS